VRRRPLAVDAWTREQGVTAGAEIRNAVLIARAEPQRCVPMCLSLRGCVARVSLPKSRRLRYLHHPSIGGHHMVLIIDYNVAL
jgi:hypothetical protein